MNYKMEDLKKFSNELVASWLDYRTCQDEYLFEIKKQIELEYNLNRNILIAYTQGLIVGKNETERKAQELVMFVEQQDELNNNKILVQEKKSFLEYSRATLDMMRDILRVEELERKGDKQ